MFEKREKARDAFAFSLGGMTAVMPFVMAPAVADDRINKIRDAHQGALQVRRAESARQADRLSEGGTDLCTQSA